MSDTPTQIAPPAPPASSDVNSAVALGYGLALHDLDAASAEAHRFLRGTRTVEQTLDRIGDARAALDRMEAALRGGA